MIGKSASTDKNTVISETPFGTTRGGTAATLISLKNKFGLTAQFSDYGATWVSMIVPDASGNRSDVLLGFDDVKGYEAHPFFSSVIGRYANRISGAKFSLEGAQYQLDQNEPPNQLHGGFENLSTRFWQWQLDEAHNLIRFKCESADGESGYPGKLKLEVSYQLTQLNELIVHYTATSDKLTHINLTNHAYFNLGDSTTISTHELEIAADLYTPVNQMLIPTGQIKPIPVSLDFRKPVTIGAKIQARKAMGETGLDHNLVFSDWNGKLMPRGRLTDPGSGRTILLKTTEPGVQIYTANHFRNISGKHNRVYPQHAGVCLETQHYPDSPNQPDFPSTRLMAGELFNSTTVFQFGNGK